MGSCLIHLRLSVAETVEYVKARLVNFSTNQERKMYYPAQLQVFFCFVTKKNKSLCKLYFRL
jgi:hypothetical protein